MTTKFEVERFAVTSSKSFDAVVTSFKTAVGRIDLAEFARKSKSPGRFSELEQLVAKGVGKTGLMLLLELDHGAVLRKESGLDKPKIIRFVIGNPLIMKEMAKHVADAGSYAPVTVLIDERDEGVRLSYDTMTSFLAPYGNEKANAVAGDLDTKVEELLRQAAL
jgi:uncharacterized protein (DUF302 family)